MIAKACPIQFDSDEESVAEGLQSYQRVADPSCWVHFQHTVEYITLEKPHSVPVFALGSTPNHMSKSASRKAETKAVDAEPAGLRTGPSEPSPACIGKVPGGRRPTHMLEEAAHDILMIKSTVRLDKVTCLYCIS